MKRAAGFTLIELVIVIVILGILGAVAAPRFLNLQGDAYEANVNALKGSIQSAMTLANTKAVLGGYDKAEPGKGKGELSDVDFVNGFPAASEDGIIAMLQDSDSFSDEANDDSAYIISTADGDPKSFKIAPRGRGLSANCFVEYTEAVAATSSTAAVPAKVEAKTDGCE